MADCNSTVPEYRNMLRLATETQLTVLGDLVRGETQLAGGCRLEGAENFVARLQALTDEILAARVLPPGPRLRVVNRT